MHIVAWPGRSVHKPCPQPTAAVSPLSGVCAKLLGGTSTKTPRIMEGSMSRAEPSALRLEIADGSILQDRTFHENALHHGKFSIQSGTIHAEAGNRGRFHFPGPNPPRFRPESRTVRCEQNQPSTRRLDITDGPCLRSAPSMLMPHIADGSILQSRTIHENAPHHGRFSIQSGTLRAEARNRGRFHSAGPNPPRKSPASWKVQCPGRNPPR